jgi:hypothetical protein
MYTVYQESTRLLRLKYMPCIVLYPLKRHSLPYSLATNRMDDIHELEARMNYLQWEILCEFCFSIHYDRYDRLATLLCLHIC